MNSFFEILTSAQAMYGMLLIIGLLIYIAFYKDSAAEHKPGKRR